MANPQLENGYTKIANELVDAFCRGFPGHGEAQVLMVILRRTYGWHKKIDTISISQIEEATTLSRRMVIYCLQNLEAKRMITITRKRGRGIKNQISTIEIQKNYEKWLVQEKTPAYQKQIQKRREKYHEKTSARKVSSARNHDLVVQEIGKNSEFLAPTKDIKDNTKDNIYARFEIFWKVYPKKKSKGQAEKAFLKIKPDEQLLATMLATIERAKKSDSWLKERGKYIPYPATWLNARGWEDEIPEARNEEEREPHQWL